MFNMFIIHAHHVKTTCTYMFFPMFHVPCACSFLVAPPVVGSSGSGSQALEQHVRSDGLHEAPVGSHAEAEDATARIEKAYKRSDLALK